MATLEVNAARDEDIWAHIEGAKANHPEYLYPTDPEFRTEADQSVTAVLSCKDNPDYEVPVEEVSTTCEAKKLLGGICGRELPCRYHK